jgi:hypothetical protein
MQVKFEFGQGRMIFWQCYPSWKKIQFPLSNFFLDVCIRLKLHLWVRHKNAQVKLEFGYGPLIFDRVIPLELWKKLKFSISAL